MRDARGWHCFHWHFVKISPVCRRTRRICLKRNAEQGFGEKEAQKWASCCGRSDQSCSAKRNENYFTESRLVSVQVSTLIWVIIYFVAMTLRGASRTLRPPSGATCRLPLCSASYPVPTKSDPIQLIYQALSHHCPLNSQSYVCQFQISSFCASRLISQAGWYPNSKLSEFDNHGSECWIQWRREQVWSCEVGHRRRGKVYSAVRECRDWVQRPVRIWGKSA